MQHDIKTTQLAHKPECDLADNEQAHEEFLAGIDLGVAELPTDGEALATRCAPSINQALDCLIVASNHLAQDKTVLAVNALHEALDFATAALRIAVPNSDEPEHVSELPSPPAKGHRFDRTPGESDENATPELSVADAQTAVAEAIAKGASGVLVVALYDSGDGATDIVACGHITVTDLAMIGARLTVTAGSWDGGQ